MNKRNLQIVERLTTSTSAKTNEEDSDGKVKILNWSDTDYELYIEDCTQINSLFIRTHDAYYEGDSGM